MKFFRTASIFNPLPPAERRWSPRAQRRRGGDGNSALRSNVHLSLEALGGDELVVLGSTHKNTAVVYFQLNRQFGISVEMEDRISPETAENTANNRHTGMGNG